MGMDPVTIGLIISAVSATASIASTQDAARKTRNQMMAEKRKADIENQYKVRRSIRQARLAQATMVNTAAQTGGMGGSGVAGGVGSVGSQLAGNLNYMASIAEENTSIFNNAVGAAKSQSNAQVFGQIGKLGNTIFSDKVG